MDISAFINKIVSNDWFVFIASIASIISFLMAFLAIKKVIKIDKYIKQTQSGSNNQQAGGDIKNV